MHAPQNVRTLLSRMLRAACDAVQAFAEVLQEENPDLFKWLTGQEPPSAAMRGNAAFMVPQSPPIHPHVQPLPRFRREAGSVSRACKQSTVVFCWVITGVILAIHRIIPSATAKEPRCSFSCRCWYHYMVYMTI